MSLFLSLFRTFPVEPKEPWLKIDGHDLSIDFFFGVVESYLGYWVGLLFDDEVDGTQNLDDVFKIHFANINSVVLSPKFTSSGFVRLVIHCDDAFPCIVPIVHLE